MIKFIPIILLLSSCGTIEYWTCYDDNNKEVYSFPMEPLDQSNYSYCKSWK